MLGYAVETRPARRKASPTTLALIVAGHAALIMAVINARMDVRPRPPEPPIVIDTIPPESDPAPVPPTPSTADTIPQRPAPIPFDDAATPDPIPIPGPIELGPLPIPGGGGTTVVPDPPKPIERIGPKLAVSESALRPPYPLAKRRLEEEAVLRLRLAIDERGRVRSVDPVGAADPMFLASARNHLIRHWRYTPASEGGRPIASTIIITLRFEIDEA